MFHLITQMWKYDLGLLGRFPDRGVVPIEDTPFSWNLLTKHQFWIKKYLWQVESRTYWTNRASQLQVTVKHSDIQVSSTQTFWILERLEFSIVRNLIDPEPNDEYGCYILQWSSEILFWCFCWYTIQSLMVLILFFSFGGASCYNI